MHHFGLDLGTYRRLLLPHLNVLSLGFGEVVPDLLMGGGRKDSLDLTDFGDKISA